MKNSSRIAGVSFLGFVSGFGAFACSLADAGDDTSAGAGSGGGSAGSPTTSLGGSSSTTGGSAVVPPLGGGGSGTQAGGGGGVTCTGGAGGTGTSGGGSGGKGGGAGAGGSGGSGGSSSGATTKGCGAATWPMTKDNDTIMVNGASRTHKLKVPYKCDAKKADRLMFSFHWLNGTANDISKGSGTAKAGTACRTLTRQHHLRRAPGHQQRLERRQTHPEQGR